MATIKKTFAFPADTVKFLNGLDMTFSPVWHHNAESKEFLTICDRDGNFVISVHHTTTSYMLRHIFSYGKCQLALGKKMAQRTIVEALGLQVNDDNQAVQFSID